MQSMGPMERGEIPVLTPLTLIYLSLGAKGLNTLGTLAPSGIVCHRSELLKLTLAVEEEQVECSKRNKRVSSYKRQQCRNRERNREQPTICQKYTRLY